jgi:hypothetical protein
MKVAPGATIEDELVEMARRVGELGPDEPMRPTLRDFADHVAGRCARIGDLYGDWDRNAGDHIRGVMHQMPDLLAKPAADDAGRSP